MAKDSLFGNIFDVDADVQSSREKSTSGWFWYGW